MTCTADSEYIRAVSVKYRRCPSSYSVRSAAVVTVPAGVEEELEVKALQPQRPQRPQRPQTAAVDHVALRVPAPSLCPLPSRHSPVLRERTQLLEELMFFYGRNVGNSLTFSRSLSPERTRNINTRKSLGPQWTSQTDALRQMYKASAKRPRHKFFSCGNLLPPTKTTTTPSSAP